jgi:hypothetical protein
LLGVGFCIGLFADMFLFAVFALRLMLMFWTVFGPGFGWAIVPPFYGRVIDFMVRPLGAATTFAFGVDFETSAVA